MEVDVASQEACYDMFINLISIASKHIFSRESETRLNPITSYI